jgi:hypothetical protein
MTRYPSFDITRFMTVDTSGDMWDIGTLVYSQDDVGQAEYLAGAAFDMPYASSKMSQFTKPYHLAGIGYEWNTQEMQRAAKLGRRSRATRPARPSAPPIASSTASRSTARRRAATPRRAEPASSTTLRRLRPGRQ